MPQIFHFKERDWHTVAVKEYTRKDQAEGREDKSACPCGVDQMKTTHHRQEPQAAHAGQDEAKQKVHAGFPVSSVISCGFAAAAWK